MKKIAFLSHESLLRLEREFESPKTLTEDILLRGIRAEIELRDREHPAITSASEEDDGSEHWEQISEDCLEVRVQDVIGAAA